MQKKTVLLQKLHYYMQEYCTKNKKDIEVIKQHIYKKYNVTSRSQLKIRDLYRIIDNYETSLKYNQE
jgi:hypothetical protein